MNNLTYWWKKYKRLRDLKKEYEKKADGCQYPAQLKEEFFDKFLKAIS